MPIRKEMPRVHGIPVLRNLLEWHPLRDLAPLFEPEREPRFVPGFDVKETLETFVVRADVPGVAEKDIGLSLGGNRLTVTGKRAKEPKVEHEIFHARERPYGDFVRSFTLPEGLDLDNLEAELRAGVLTITAVKRPGHKPRKIPVKDLEKGSLAKVAKA